MSQIKKNGPGAGNAGAGTTNAASHNNKGGNIMLHENINSVNPFINEQRYAEFAMRSQVDRKIHRLQQITFGNCDDGDYAIGSVTTYGYNNWTRTLFEGNHDTVEIHQSVVDDFGAPTGEFTKNVTSNLLCNIPATLEYCKVQLQNKASSAVFMTAVTKRGLRVQYLPDGRVVLWIINGLGKHEYVLLDQVITDLIVLEGSKNDHNPGLRSIEGSTWVRYGDPFGGPSNERKVSCLLFRWHDNETREEFDKRWIGIFDLLNGGLCSKLMQKGTMPYKKAYKLRSRLALGWTPQTPFMQIRGIGYLCGSFGKNIPGSEIDFDCSDGEMIANAGSVNNEMHIRGFETTERGICGIAPQMRAPGDKGLVHPVMSKSISVYEAQFKKAGKLIRIDTLAEFEAMYDAGECQEGYYYKAGNEVADIVVDDNSMKAMAKISDPKLFWLNLVDVFQRSEGQLNKQIVACTMHLPGAIDFFKTAMINKAMEEFGKLDAALNGTVVPSTKPIIPDSYVNDLIYQVSPQYAVHDPALYKELVENVGRTLVKSIGNLNLPISDSYYLRSRCDMAATLFGVRILRNNECYIANGKAGKWIAYRNPKSGKIEYYWFENVSFETVVARIEALRDKIGDEAAKVLIDEFRLVGEAMIITPADPNFADSTGGSDHDGDGFMVTANAPWVEIQMQQTLNESVNIPKAKDDGRTSDLSIEAIMAMGLDGLFGPVIDDKGNRSFPEDIGQICNTYQQLSVLENQTDDMLQKVLDVLEYNIQLSEAGIPLIGREADPYQSRFGGKHSSIDNDAVREAYYGFLYSDRSIGSFRRALADGNLVGISVIGRGVDAKKNGDQVYTGFLGLLKAIDLSGEAIPAYEGAKKVKVYYNADTSSEVDKDGKFIVNINVVPETNYDVLYVDDPVTNLKNRVLKRIEARINEYLSRKVSLCESELQDLQCLEHTRYANPQDLRLMREIYGNLITEKANLPAHDKNAAMSAFKNTCRRVFAPGTPAHLVYLGMRAASMQGDDYSKFTSMSRALEEESVRAAAYYAQKEGFVTNRVVGFEVMPVNNYVAFQANPGIVSFVDGVSEGALYVSGKKFSGDFQIEFVNGHFYATQTVDQYFDVKLNNQFVAMANVCREKSEETVNNRHVDVKDVQSVRLSAGFGNGHYVYLDNDGDQRYGLWCGGREKTWLKEQMHGCTLNVRSVVQFRENSRHLEHTLFVGVLKNTKDQPFPVRQIEQEPMNPVLSKEIDQIIDAGLFNDEDDWENLEQMG